MFGSFENFFHRYNLNVWSSLLRAFGKPVCPSDFRCQSSTDQCLELAKSRRQQAPSITTGFGGKADVKGVKADMPLNSRRIVLAALKHGSRTAKSIALISLAQSPTTPAPVAYRQPVRAGIGRFNFCAAAMGQALGAAGYMRQGMWVDVARTPRGPSTKGRGVTFRASYLFSAPGKALPPDIPDPIGPSLVETFLPMCAVGTKAAEAASPYAIRADCTQQRTHCL
jgi:hypothetical protein